jgi:hypothetical protein
MKSSFFHMTSLVGGLRTPLKNMKVSWEYYSQYMEKNRFQTTSPKSPAFSSEITVISRHR